MVRFQKFLFILYCCVLFLMILVMGLSVHVVVPLGVAAGLSELKPLVLALMFGLAALLWIATGAKAKWEFVGISMIFPAYYCLVGLLRKRDFSFVAAIIYLCWFLFIAIASRYWLRSVDRCKTVVGVVLAALTLLFAIGSISYIVLGDSIDTFAGRFALGFENPNFFAQIALVGLIAVSWLLVDCTQKVRHVVVLVGGMFAISLSAAAVSRSGGGWQRGVCALGFGSERAPEGPRGSIGGGQPSSHAKHRGLG